MELKIKIYQMNHIKAYIKYDLKHLLYTIYLLPTSSLDHDDGEDSSEKNTLGLNQ